MKFENYDDSLAFANSNENVMFLFTAYGKEQEGTTRPLSREADKQLILKQCRVMKIMQ